MARVKITGSVDKWAKEAAENLEKDQPKALLQAAEVAAGAIRKRVFSEFKPGHGGLARSFTATLLQPKDGKVRSGALSDLVYARIQNEGGTIKPKRAKALTVPLSPQAKMASDRGVGPREFPSKLSLVWPKGRPQGFLVEEQADRSVFHYLLTGSVNIDGKHYIEKAAKDSADDIAEIVGDAATAAVKKAKT